MRRFGFLEIVLVILSVLVLLAVFTMILLIAYPNASQNIMRDVRQNYGTPDRLPVITVVIKIVRRAGEGFNYRLRPLISAFVDFFSGPGKAKKAPSARVIAFSRCPKCHADLFERRGFNNIYIDHRVHEAESVACSTCHVRGPHPKADGVKQEKCISCHKRRGAPTSCNTCHPPGSILADTVIPQAHTQAFLADRVISKRVLMPAHFEQPDPQWLAGNGDPPCRQCHLVPDFCNRCHLVFHKTDPNWRPTHGRRLLAQELEFVVCWTCHNANWCAGTCHPNQKQARGSRFLPVPRLPLDQYINR